ncbi:MAG: hypothetical protein WCH39_06260 [Schlesneria sp.]
MLNFLAEVTAVEKFLMTRKPSDGLAVAKIVLACLGPAEKAELATILKEVDQVADEVKTVADQVGDATK